MSIIFALKIIIPNYELESFYPSNEGLIGPGDEIDDDASNAVNVSVDTWLTPK